MSEETDEPIDYAHTHRHYKNLLGMLTDKRNKGDVKAHLTTALVEQSMRPSGFPSDLRERWASIYARATSAGTFADSIEAMSYPDAERLKSDLEGLGFAFESYQKYHGFA